MKILKKYHLFYNQYWVQIPQNVNYVQTVTPVYGTSSKLVDKGREVYSISVEKNWHSNKSVFIAHFGEQRDENNLFFCSRSIIST